MARKETPVVGQDPVPVAYHPAGMVPVGRQKRVRPVTLPRGYLTDLIGIFGHLSVPQMHRFIDEVMAPSKSWRYESLQTLRDQIAHPRARSAKDVRAERELTQLGQDTGNNRHHIFPGSRGGKSKKNLVRLPLGFHSQWHKLFANLTVPETHVFLDTLLVSGKRWTYRTLYVEQRALVARSTSP